MPKNQQTTLQMALPLTLDDKASFANFLEGDNREVVQALKARLSDHNQTILYFYGISGAGKSHLMFAMQRLAQQQQADSIYLSLQDPRMTVELIEMVEANSIVCIDDVNAWAGDSEKERALFALFERVKHQHGQLIISASQSPDCCGFELTDLVSRLASGLVYPLHTLNEDQQFEAIKLRANHRGLRISDEVIKYLLSRSSRDSTQLFDLLDQIDKASLIEKRRITIPFLQTLLTG